MPEAFYERYCQFLDRWQLAHPKRWWTWWRVDSSIWTLYSPNGRKVFDAGGNCIDGNCMRRFIDGCWEYRALTRDEAADDELWYAIR